MPKDQWAIVLRDVHPGYISWQSFLTNAQTITYPTVGHFVPDEAGDAAAAEIQIFMQDRDVGARAHA